MSLWPATTFRTASFVQSIAAITATVTSFSTCLSAIQQSAQRGKCYKGVTAQQKLKKGLFYSCVPPLISTESPNNSPAIDAAVTIFSHEIQDLLTDPREDAWVIKQNANTIIELGDFCAGRGVTQEQWFGTVSQVEGTNATYNLQVKNNKYLVQTIYSLNQKKCVLSD